MFIYFSLFFWIVFNSLTRSRYIQLLTILIFIIIVGFRYQVGGDWYPYLMMYKEISGTNLLFSLTYTDPAYGLINYIAYTLNQEIWFINLICAVIFFIGIDHICKFSHRYWIALLTSFPYLIITVSMGYTRQSAAIGLIFIAFTKLMQKKKFSFLLFIFLAILFHKSAILILIFTPYIFNYKFTFFKNSVYLLMFVILLFGIMNNFNNEDNLYFTDQVSSSGALLRMVIHLPPIILYLAYRNKFKGLFKDNVVILDVILGLILIFFLISFVYSTFADRFNLYFYIFDILILSTFPTFLNYKNYYVYLLLIIILQFILYSSWLYLSPYAECCWIPYQNYLFK